MNSRGLSQPTHSRSPQAAAEPHPIRIAVSCPPAKEGSPFLERLVKALNTAYPVGVVLAVESEEADISGLAERLRQLVPPSLVVDVSHETTASRSREQITAALASLEAADPNLALVLVIGDPVTAQSLLATDLADLMLQIGGPTATMDTRLSPQAQGNEQDDRILVIPHPGETDHAQLLAWLESHLERYRHAWAGQEGAERLRPRSTVSPAEQRSGKLPKYEYECKACETRFVVERPMSEASSPYACPFCGGPTRRVYSAPKLLFKADPTETRPVWHTHGVPGSANSFSHAHPDPRRRHGDLEERLRQKGGGSSE